MSTNKQSLSRVVLSAVCTLLLALSLFYAWFWLVDWLQDLKKITQQQKKTEVRQAYSAQTVSHILGLPAESSESVPVPKNGEIVVYYGGWTLQELRNTPVGKKHMWISGWYDEYQWKAAPGYYRVVLLFPGSEGKTFEEQLRHLRVKRPGMRPAPIPVAVTAFLMHVVATGKDPLQEQYSRCAERLPDREGVDGTAIGAVTLNRVYPGFSRDHERHHFLAVVSQE